MSNSFLLIAVALGGAGLAAGYVLRWRTAERRVGSAEAKAKALVSEAASEADRLRREAELTGRDLQLRLKSDFERDTHTRREELVGLERRLLSREENLDRKVDLFDKKEREFGAREKALVDKEKSLEERQKDLELLIAQERERLVKMSGLSLEDARRLLLARVEQDAKAEAAVLSQRIENEAREESARRAREILAQAIQRYAAEQTVETTVSVVTLPKDELKGRIIGRDGRNIRALEMATGIDVIVDDTPGTVVLSGFDMVRREIARIALERLLADGRIHPARIEEMVERVRREMDQTIVEEGEKAALELNVRGLHPEIVKLLGRLRYRTSYGQNVLQHSKEMAYVMAVMASELHLDPALARRIGLIHDIGKAVSHEVEGPHALIGADLAKKYGEPPEVVHAVACHNEDIPIESVWGTLASAADAVSAARPGARRDTLENYIKRLEKLEAVADSFPGVEKSFAIQAGREIRVIVEPARVKDDGVGMLARDISKKIQESLEFPGQIKVTVIRETRAVEIAK